MLPGYTMFLYDYLAAANSVISSQEFKVIISMFKYFIKKKKLLKKISFHFLHNMLKFDLSNITEIFLF